MTNVRESVRGIIFKKPESVILMHRIKNGSEYWVLPGGGIDSGEDVQAAFTREIEEELGSVTIKGMRYIATLENIISEQKIVQHIYFSEYVSGDIFSGKGPEFTERLSTDNYYAIEEIPLSKIPAINLLPQEAKALILECVK